MKKARGQNDGTLRGEFWGHTIDRGAREYYFYPSERALRLFYYVRSIGEARLSSEFRKAHRDETGFLFHLVINGELHHLLRGKTFVACPGDGCLLDLAEPVEYGQAAPGTRLYWVLFDSILMPKVFRELGADLDPIFPGLDVKQCGDIFRELTRLVARQASSDEAKISASLMMLLAELFPQRAAMTRALPPGIDPNSFSEATRRALAYMERFYMQPVQLKNVAKRAGLSLYHFCRLFHRETGMTPKNYANRYRVEQAKILLATTAKPVSQIAQMVGLPDPEFFATFFSKTTGLTPREYRARSQRKPPA